ncbi:MAG: flavodoxin [Planctomycetota bacterium]
MDVGNSTPLGTIQLFFGSDSGNTERIAELLAEQLKPLELDPINIEDCDVAQMMVPDILILGVSTWNFGEIQSSWEDKLEELMEQDFSEKRVAIFGLGDCVDYADTFVDGMGILWEAFGQRPPQLIGKWPKQGYSFIESRGLVDEDHFYGLVIDEDTEPELTDDRVARWAMQLKRELQLDLRAAG